MGRSLAFLFVQAPLAILLTLAYASAACAAGLIDRSGRATHRLARRWSRLLLALLRVGVSVRGGENVVCGPAVYAANHASTLDIFVVFGHLPVEFRIIHKRSISFLPFVGWAIAAGGHVAIDRSHPFRARRSLDAAARRIRGGTSVVVFPEGTRSADGSVGRFKRGSFRLAIEAGVPVVPVSLAGVKALVPTGLASLRPGEVQVVLHRPVSVAGRSVEEAETLAEETRQIVVAGCRQEGKDG